MKLLKLSGGLVLYTLYSSTVSATVIYSEDFSTNPGFTLSNEVGIAGQADSVAWTSVNETLDINLNEYGFGANKYAITPIFSRLAA